MARIYIAEDVPADRVLNEPGDYLHRPLTDEDCAMSAPLVVAKGTNETGIRHELALHLITCTAGMTADRQKIHYAASTAITEGVDAVQISGRVYRIRAVDGS